MSTEAPRQGGTWRQTRVLLYKNLLYLNLISKLNQMIYIIHSDMIQPNKRHGRMPDAVLYSTNRTSVSEFIVGYTPITNVTRKIMHKMLSEYCPEEVQKFLTEEEMKEASLLNPEKFIGVIFKDSMSYHLRVPRQMIPESSSHLESKSNCSKSFEMCEAEVYWYHGFTALQICIDAAIIEFKTNYSVLEGLEETEVVIMGKSAAVEIDYFFRGVILIYLVIAFSPFGYYLTIHIMTEKEKKLKEFLIVMGLQDTAFWYVSLFI
uniref:Uncharacterized protein n=1 Tax=Naja naja TaxID=35670 RepID=A0A8C6VFY8_NAJNA